MSIPLAEFIHDLDADNLPGPRAHYALGWLPRWSRIASLMPRAANLAMRLPLVGRVALFAAGVDQRRSIPSFAPKTFRQWFASTAHTRSSAGKPVILFIDSFNNHFTPSVAEAMVDVLESAGYSPRLTAKQQCCGLTWISTGQLDAAKRILGETIDELAKSARAGIPIVGIEPSCTGVCAAKPSSFSTTRRRAMSPLRPTRSPNSF